MPLKTNLTEILNIRHPIIQAPMSGVAGGALAGAVSNAGGHAAIRGTLSLVREVIEDIITEAKLCLKSPPGCL